MSDRKAIIGLLPLAATWGNESIFHEVARRGCSGILRIRSGCECEDDVVFSLLSTHRDVVSSPVARKGTETPSVAVMHQRLCVLTTSEAVRAKHGRDAYLKHIKVDMLPRNDEAEATDLIALVEKRLNDRDVAAVVVDLHEGGHANAAKHLAAVFAHFLSDSSRWNYYYSVAKLQGKTCEAEEESSGYFRPAQSCAILNSKPVGLDGTREIYYSSYCCDVTRVDAVARFGYDDVRSSGCNAQTLADSYFLDIAYALSLTDKYGA